MQGNAKKSALRVYPGEEVGRGVWPCEITPPSIVTAPGSPMRPTTSPAQKEKHACHPGKSLEPTRTLPDARSLAGSVVNPDRAPTHADRCHEDRPSGASAMPSSFRSVRSRHSAARRVACPSLSKGAYQNIRNPMEWVSDMTALPDTGASGPGRPCRSARS